LIIQNHSLLTTCHLPPHRPQQHNKSTSTLIAQQGVYFEATNIASHHSYGWQILKRHGSKLSFFGGFPEAKLDGSCYSSCFLFISPFRSDYSEKVCIRRWNQCSTSDGGNQSKPFLSIVLIICHIDSCRRPFPRLPFPQRNLKSSKNSDRNSVIFRLNDIERLIFIIGVAIQSCVWFCPLSTDGETLGLVYDTTTNASVLLVLCPILTYLQRCTTTFSSFRASGFVMLTSFGLVFFTTGNFFQYDCIGRRTVVYLGWGVEGLSIFFYFSLIGFCAFKYLHTNLRTSLDRKAFLALLINLF
jgi:hypothetical protein